MPDLGVGRELDAMIAERILGATWGSEAHTWEGCEWLRFSADQSPRSMVTLAARGKLASGRSIEVWDACPRYSTDIRDAWEILDKMRADGWDLTFGFSRATPGWWWIVGSNDDRDDVIEVDAETFPLCICNAALQAVSQHADLTPEQQQQIDRLNAVAEQNIQQQIIARDHLLQQVLTGPDPDENRRDWNESPQESKP